MTTSASVHGGVAFFLHSFYHRIRMLSPNLKAVGMGLVHGTVVLDTATRIGRGEFAPFSWPVDGATDVPCSWVGGEWPRPIGTEPFDHDTAVRFGYPISLTFPTPAVRSVRATLTCAGEVVEVFVSTPEAPGNAALRDNRDSIRVMARRPLPPDCACEVHVTGEHAGKPFERRWTFRTRKR